MDILASLDYIRAYIETSNSSVCRAFFGWPRNIADSSKRYMALDSRQVDKPIRKLRKLLKKMPAEPTPKQVHDLRTNSRRLEAMLQAMDPSQSRRKVLKELSKLRKRAGKVRDMDVLTGYAAEVQRTGDGDDCSVRLLEHLGAVRRKKARKLSTASQEGAPVLRKRLKRVSTELQESVSVRKTNGSETSSHVTSAALRLLGDLEKPTTLNKSNLHPYRLKVKELQNLLRLAEKAKDQEFVETLGKVKDAIGEWHDWVELQGIAHKVLNHPQCALVRELKTRTDERFEQALNLAKNLRKKYLGAASTPGGKRKVPRPAESVWSATASLAA
jgi:CHAD domain-containing protein